MEKMLFIFILCGIGAYIFNGSGEKKKRYIMDLEKYNFIWDRLHGSWGRRTWFHKIIKKEMDLSVAGYDDSEENLEVEYKLNRNYMYHKGKLVGHSTSSNWYWADSLIEDRESKIKYGKMIDDMYDLYYDHLRKLSDANIM